MLKQSPPTSTFVTQLFLRKQKHMSVKALEYKDAHTSHTRLRLEPLCPVELSAGILRNVTWLKGRRPSCCVVVGMTKGAARRSRCYLDFR